MISKYSSPFAICSLLKLTRLGARLSGDGIFTRDELFRFITVDGFDNIIVVHPIEMVLFSNSYAYGAMDHFTLFAWIPLIIIGIIAGHVFMIEKRSDPPPKNKYVKALQKIGANSFVIYAMHFPIIYAVLFPFRK